MWGGAVERGGAPNRVQSDAMTLPVIDIPRNIDIFKKSDGKDAGRDPEGRYASFDYCFNHFQSFRTKNAVSEIASQKNLETSCLQLGFYLASWGMLRGSSFLLQKSIKFYERLINDIAKFNPTVWNIDVDRYQEDATVLLLLECKEMIATALGLPNRASDTLITKIMLGIFGNVPAFDTFFCTGFGVGAFGMKSLAKISAFYQANKSEIDSQRIATFEFLSGKESEIFYSKAKIIDMVGVIEGDK